MNLRGCLKGYREVWYSDKGIDNILSLNNIKRKYYVTYNSYDRNEFVVTLDNYTITFQYSSMGLYYHDMSKANGYALVQTMRENMKQFTTRKIKAADTA